MTHFTMLVAPDFARNADNTRSAKRGAFHTHARIEKSLWLQMKDAGARYISESEEDDGVGIAGWNYPVKSLCIFIKAGNPVALEGIECKTVKELFDAIEKLPEHRKKIEQAAQAARDELSQDRARCAGLAATASGKKECNNWSWDDMRHCIHDILAETEHYVAKSYWFKSLETNDEKLIGFVVERKS